MKQLAYATALLIACGDDASMNPMIDAPGGQLDAAIDMAGPPPDPLVGIGTVTLVQGGYMFTEGPQWRETQGDLVFTDIPASTVYRYTPGGGAPVVHRNPSSEANGLAIDGAGSLIAAEHLSRSVTRDGGTIVDTFENKALNSPNDVIVHSDGTIYFTDPPYGLGQSRTMQLDFCGVYRIQTNGMLTAEHRVANNCTKTSGERPNGIGISPDGNTIYVADTATSKLWKFARNSDGSLQPRVQLAMTSGGGDGLAIDIYGNIFVTTVGGIDVFKPDGTKWGVITVPMQPANCAFGDADHKTLYITARTALYKVRLANAGLPRN